MEKFKTQEFDKPERFTYGIDSKDNIKFRFDSVEKFYRGFTMIQQMKISNFKSINNQEIELKAANYNLLGLIHLAKLH